MRTPIQPQKESQIPVYMTQDEARVFIEFKKRYKVIAYILGFMNTMRIDDMTETNMVFDVDKSGIISHVAITKHFRS